MKHAHIAGLCRVWRREVHVERTSRETEVLLAAAEHRGTSKREPVTLDSALIWSHLLAHSLFFKLLGLKSGFIFTLTS